MCLSKKLLPKKYTHHLVGTALGGSKARSRSRWWFSSFATCLLLTIVTTVVSRVWSQTSAEPIIDMHLHAKHADELGTPPLYICAPFLTWPVKHTHEDAQTYFARMQNQPACPSPLRPGTNDEDLMRRTLAVLNTRNVTVTVTWRPRGHGKVEAGIRGPHPSTGLC